VSLKENIKIALFSIKTNLMRSLLTMLGIIIGVASVITIITVGDGGADYIVGMINEMGGSSTIQISVKMSQATASDYFTPKDIAALQTVPEIAYVSPLKQTFGTASTQSETAFAMAFGGNSSLQYILASECRYGQFFTEQEYKSASPVALIDAVSAKTMFGKENCVGESLTFSVEGRSVNVRIVGVLSLSGLFGSDTESMSSMMEQFGGGMDMASCIMMFPATFLVNFSGSQERYDTLYLTSVEDSLLTSAGETALSILQAQHNNADRDVYMVTNLAQFVDLIDSVIRIFTLFIAAVSAISLVVGGVGVMNIMLVSVTERTREIGIRKALGARTNTILMQFLTESVVICFIGGVIGLILGVVLAAIVAAVMNVPLSVKLWTIALAIGFSSGIGIFFGIYPAKRAAQLPPIEALRKD
jgi:putative ABC transport system permease protein